MPHLTIAQRLRILDAFLTIDPQAYVDRSGRGEPALYYEGYVTVEGLLHVAAVIADIQAESAAEAIPPNAKKGA